MLFQSSLGFAFAFALLASSSSGSHLLDTFCDGQGTLQDGTTPVCLGDVAQSTFAQAICACGTYASTSPLTVSSFPAGTSASVEVDDGFTSVGPVSVAGPLTLPSNIYTRVTGDLTVAGTLANGSGLVCNSDVSVGGDALLGGNTSVWGTLQVHGKTTITPGARLYVGLGSTPSATLGPVNVTPACPCGVQDEVDIVGLVHSYAQNNDNGAIGLDPAAFTNVATAQNVTLPCGRYYLSSIMTDAPLNIFAQGRVALFVDGDVVASDMLRIIADPNADLDVFVTGGVDTSGPFHFGRVSAPQRARLYVGGAFFYTSGGLNLAGNLYAPHANLDVSTETHVLGALLVYNLYQSASLKVTYDSAVSTAGSACGSPTDPNTPVSNPNTPTTDPNTIPSGPTCASCSDCDSASTCTASGVCGPCDDNTPCCAGFKCMAGTCVNVSG